MASYEYKNSLENFEESVPMKKEETSLLVVKSQHSTSQSRLERMEHGLKSNSKNLKTLINKAIDNVPQNKLARKIPLKQTSK